MANPYFVSVADVRQIAGTSGLSHAEFCVDQMETQMGSEACVEQRAEIARLHDAAWQAHVDSCADLGDINV